MNTFESIFNDEIIQRQTLEQERMKALRIAAKNIIQQGVLSIPVIASCLKISIDEVEYIAKHIAEIEELEAEDEMRLTS